MEYKTISESECLVEGSYIVKKDGSVYGLGRYRRPRLLRPRLHTNGYHRIGIFSDGKQKDVYIHRLVATAFLPNPKGYREVNHIDGDKTNNNVSNLEWCDRAYNNKHAFRIGLRTNEQMRRVAQRPKIKARKFTVENIRYIRSNPDRLSQCEMARRFNVGHETIRHIINKLTYKEVV